MPVKVLHHQTTGAKLILIAVLAIALCLTPCGVAGQHGTMGTPSMPCIVDLPQIFQLVIVINMLLFAVVALAIVSQAPAFSLLKPPRPRFALL